MLFKSNLLTLVTIGYIVGFIVGMYIEYCYGPKWLYYSFDWIYGIYWTVWDRIRMYCIWVELPVQRRLCPIF